MSKRWQQTRYLTHVLQQLGFETFLLLVIIVFCGLVIYSQLGG